MRLAMFKSDNSIPPFSSLETEQQIRVARSLAVSARVGDTVRTFAHWLPIFALRSIRLVRGLVAEGRRRRTICELQRFDDRTLADIGVPRGEIEFLVHNGRPIHLIQTAAAQAEGARSMRLLLDALRFEPNARSPRLDVD
jgi:uncharacterized protein YjiS (DUF1127 family)